MPAVGDDFHALLSPSRAHRYLRCPGSVALEEFTANGSSEYADEGTAKHTLFAMVFGADQLVKGEIVKAAHTQDFIGQTIMVGETAYEVTFDFAEPVQSFVDQVRELLEPGDILMVEQRVDYSADVGVPGQSGTADVMIVKPARKALLVIDAKFGRGVRVVARDNEQARLYGKGALNAIELAYEIDTVHNIIIQPSIADGTTEERLTVAELNDWIERVAKPGSIAAFDIYERVHLGEGGVAGSLDEVTSVQLSELNPGEKQCKFCRAKTRCPALTQSVMETVGGSFLDLDAEEKPGAALSARIGDLSQLDNEALAKRLRLVPLIQGWCNDILALGDARLLAGEVVPGFKVVQGKRGNRAWVDDPKVEAYLKRKLGRAEAMVETIISPTVAEKKFKRDPKSWDFLAKTYITQSEGKPAVVPEDDPRPTYVLPQVAEAFAALEDNIAEAMGATEPEALLEDLSDLA